jgi:outer membrane receptor protein involved in Fe transport
MPLSRLTGGLLLIASAAATATDTPPIQQVQIAGARADQRQRETTTAIVVNHEELVRQGDQTLADVLKRLPGISISGTPGQGGAIQMRGLGNGYTQIMLNGEPVAAGFSLDSIAPEMIERVEIMRSATAEFSNQAVAGAINVILKKAVQRGQRSISAGVARQAGATTPTLTAQLSDQRERFSYSLAATATRKRTETPFTEWEELRGVAAQASSGPGPLLLLRRTPQTDSGHTDALTLTPRLSWTLAGGDTVNWQSFVNVRRVDNQHRASETAIVGGNSEFPRNAAAFVANFTMLRSDVTWTHLMKDGAKLETKLGVSSNRRSGSFDFYGSDIDGNAKERHVVDSGPTENSGTASGTYRHPVGERHALALGWDVGRAARREDRDERIFAPGGEQTSANNADYRADVDRVAFFMQDEWEATKNFSLYLGLRHERLKTASRADAANAPAALDVRSAVWSPSLQSRYVMANKDVLRLAVSRTYKAPLLAKLVPRRYVNDNNNNPTNPDEQGNPNLRPELAWGLDAAYEHYLGDGALLSVSTYLRRIRDVTVTRVFEQDGEWVEVPFNNGDASVRGVELEAKLPLRRVLPSAPAVDLRANLARNWSRVGDVPGPHNRLETQTPFTANLGADYRVDGTALTVGGNLNYQAGGPVRQAAQVKLGSSPKRELDLYALWKVDTRTQLRVAGSNLLRQSATEWHEYTDADSIRRRTTITPGAASLRIVLERQL